MGNIFRTSTAVSVTLPTSKKHAHFTRLKQQPITHCLDGGQTYRFSLKTMESLQNGVTTYFQATPLITMKTKLQVSSQSCRSIDADAWCKWALTMCRRIRESVLNGPRPWTFEQSFPKRQMPPITDVQKSSYDTRGSKIGHLGFVKKWDKSENGNITEETSYR